MQLKSIAFAAAILASGAANAIVIAPVTQDFGAYTVTYKTDTSFHSISSSFSSGSTVGFEWTVDPSVNLASLGGVAQSATFVIPDFTITAKPGYTLSGAVDASLGNIVYFLNGNGAMASITGTGKVSVNGGAAVTVPATALTQTQITSSSGYFSGSQSIAVGAFNTFALSNASITLAASGGTFAAIVAQPQNKLRFEFTAAPVPEPETYALLLAGLGAIGFMVRRRQQY